MPGIDNATAIKYGQMLDNDVKNNLFGHLECMILEFEKVYMPFLQVCPKKYCGMKYEFDPTKGKVAASGLQMVKRDSALLCKRTMQTFFEYLLVKKDKDRALESIKVQLADLFSNNLPLEDFCITKKISKRPEDYKVTPPHIEAWGRMVRRVGVTEAPAVGERMEYIILKHGKKDNMADFIIDTALVRERGFDRFNVYKEKYFDLYIYNPLNVIVKLVYGEQVMKKVLNPKAYTQVETVSAQRGNLLGFFKVDQLTRKRKFHGLGVDEKLQNEIRQLRLSDMVVEEETIQDPNDIVESVET